MSRRYPTAELYEEQERDFYSRGPRRSVREFEDFDYGPSSAGPVVVRERTREEVVDVDDTRSIRSTASRPRGSARREVEKEEVIIREEDRRPPPRPRMVEEDEYIIRRGEGARPSRPPEFEEIEIRREQREPPPPRPRVRDREVDREEIDIRTSRIDRPPPPSSRPREVERDEFIIRRGEGERRQPPKREVDKEEIIIRDTERPRSRHPSPPREVEKEQVIIRETERSRPRRPSPPKEVEKEEIIFRETERTRSRRPSPPREVEKEEIIFREQERPRSRRPSPRREVEREEIIFREPERPRSRRLSPRREIVKQELIFRDDDTRSVRSSRPPEAVEEREKLVYRTHSRGPLRDDLVARESEEVVIRRRRPPSSSSSSPSPPPVREREKIIIRERKERSPSPPLPPPEPEPVRFAPIIRPPIHQEIITHHRHIDHGIQRAPVETEIVIPPRSRSPSPPKVESTEIEIRRRSKGKDDDEEIKIERHSRDRDTKSERGGDEIILRSRSMDVPRSRQYYDDNAEVEADYYNRRALERTYPGEAYNGATKDWALVDVPPGTERVRLDGAGGGRQEITWQRYNGTRRSKFVTSEREFDAQYGLTAPPPPPPPEPVEERRITITKREEAPARERKSEMWTEITKDLVLKEAIEHVGYEYEETEYFFYVMEYLRYEDVVQLVDISSELKRNRRRRIREIEWEREDPRLPRPPLAEDRVFEREIVFDRKRTN